MTPTESISHLDAAIARRGESITLKRGATSVMVKALVRAVSANEIAGTITQTDFKVIVSPTGLAAIGQLKTTDKVVVKGKERQVKFANNIHMADTWVRTDLVIGG